jgi:hypothetical protein
MVEAKKGEDKGLSRKKFVGRRRSCSLKDNYVVLSSFASLLRIFFFSTEWQKVVRDRKDGAR